MWSAAPWHFTLLCVPYCDNVTLPVMLCLTFAALRCAALSQAVPSYRSEDGGISAALSPAPFSDHNYKKKIFNDQSGAEPQPGRALKTVPQSH